MGIIAWVVATILSVIFIPIGMIYGFFKTFWKRQIGAALKNLDNKFFAMAVSGDQYGNVACAELFNLILIKKNAAYKFGNPDETISSVLGKNKRASTITRAGKGLCWLLGIFEKEHVIRAIEEDEL